MRRASRWTEGEDGDGTSGGRQQEDSRAQHSTAQRRGTHRAQGTRVTAGTCASVKGTCGCCSEGLWGVTDAQTTTAACFQCMLQQTDRQQILDQGTGRPVPKTQRTGAVHALVNKCTQPCPPSPPPLPPAPAPGAERVEPRCRLGHAMRAWPSASSAPGCDGVDGRRSSQSRSRRLLASLAAPATWKVAQPPSRQRLPHCASANGGRSQGRATCTARHCHTSLDDGDVHQGPLT